MCHMTVVIIVLLNHVNLGKRCIHNIIFRQLYISQVSVHHVTSLRLGVSLSAYEPNHIYSKLYSLLHTMHLAMTRFYKNITSAGIYQHL